MQLMQIYSDENLLSQDFVEMFEEIIQENRALVEKYTPAVNQWLMDNFV